MPLPTGPITALPPGYREAYAARVSQRRAWPPLLALTLAALLISGGVLFGALAAYHAVGAPLVIGALPDSVPRLLGYALVLGVLPLHEWVHGRMIGHYGHSPRYGLKWYALYTTADSAYFRRDEYLRVLLAPLVIITLGGVIVLPFVPWELASWIALAVVVNASGAGGDLWMAIIARRYDAAALIRDEADGMRVYLRISNFEIRISK
ncbi:MAG: DUF3267 domain-containing protein [Anaerolineae bacterium]|nr:DUF3267 domain-containing protein [Anaerolineae bacterium]